METFRVMAMHGKFYPPNQVTSVPWSFVEAHEAQAWENHTQTLKRLNERGGLDPVELYAVVHDLKWRVASEKVTMHQAIEWLKSKPWES